MEVFADEGDPRLTAAIELVSPRNKDRYRAREAFASKCAGYLRRGCGLVVIDAVTTRRADLQADLMSALGVEEPSSSSTLSAVLRAVGHDQEGQLQGWPTALEVGQPLPTMPLWLGTTLRFPGPGGQPFRGLGDLRIRHGVTGVQGANHSWGLSHVDSDRLQGRVTEAPFLSGWGRGGVSCSGGFASFVRIAAELLRSRRMAGECVTTDLEGGAPLRFRRSGSRR